MKRSHLQEASSNWFGRLQNCANAFLYDTWYSCDRDSLVMEANGGMS